MQSGGGFQDFYCPAAPGVIPMMYFNTLPERSKWLPSYTIPPRLGGMPNNPASNQLRVYGSTIGYCVTGYFWLIQRPTASAYPLGPWNGVTPQPAGGDNYYPYPFVGAYPTTIPGRVRWSYPGPPPQYQTYDHPSGADSKFSPADRPVITDAILATETKNGFDYDYSPGAYTSGSTRASSHLDKATGLPRGGNKAFMDGHVAWFPFSGTDAQVENPASNVTWHVRANFNGAAIGNVNGVNFLF